MIVHLQFALLLQDQYCHGRKLLGRGTQVKPGVWCVGRLLSPVGHAIAFAQEHLAIVCDQHRAAELLVCSLVRKQVIYLGGNQYGLRVKSCMSGERRLLAMMIQLNRIDANHQDNEEACNYQ